MADRDRAVVALDEATKAAAAAQQDAARCAGKLNSAFALPVLPPCSTASHSWQWERNTPLLDVRYTGLSPQALLLMCVVPFRLRRALLDAEIDTQRSTVAADTATKRLSELEAELTKAK